jgi:DNA-binding MarR family transcriptional regulator
MSEDADADADPLVDALVQTSFLVMSILAKVAAERDLSLTQLRMLGILRDRRPRMARLAAHLGLDKSSVSGLVERAERRGLVERVPSADDARATEVVITDAGLRLAIQGAEQVRIALEPHQAHLPAAARRRLTTDLAALLGAEGP